MVRVKHRYLLVNILYPELSDGPLNPELPDILRFHQPTTDKVQDRDLIRGIKAEAEYMFGDYGAGAISDSSVKYWSPATSTFIIKVARAHYQIVWAALSLMDHVPVKGGKNCVFRVVRVSGTIRKSQEEAVRRAKDMMVKAQQEMNDQSNSTSTLDSIFGKGKETNNAKSGSAMDLLNIDQSDDEEDEGPGDEG